MKKFYFLLLVMSSSLVALSQPKKRKLLVIGIDGCKVTALQKVMADGNAPNMKTIMEKGTYSWDGLTLYPTWSATGWASILTGVKSDKHRSVENSFTGNNIANYPSFLNRITRNNKNTFTASLVNWTPITDIIVSEACLNVASGRGQGNSYVVNDGKTRDSIVHLLQYDYTDVIFSQFDNVDGSGHSYGFSETVPQYYNAIVGIDAYVGNFITAINNRPTRAQEDWLYIICTDHGGNGAAGHGSNTYNERNVYFIVSDNDNSGTATDFIPSARINRDTVTTTMPATVYRGGGVKALTTSPSYGFGTADDFTIEMRIRKTGTTQDKAFVSDKNWSTGLNAGWALAGALGNDNSWKFNMGNGSSRVDLDGGRIDDGLWHHIAVSVDRDGRKAAYQDGQLVAVVNNNITGSITSGLPLGIGNDGQGNFTAGIEMAEIRLWKTALSQADLENWQNLTLNTSHPQYTSILNYYPVTETSGATVTDNGPLANNAAVAVATQNSWKTESGTNFLEINPAFVRSDAAFAYNGLDNLTVEAWVKTGNWANTDGTIVSDKDWDRGGYKGWVLATVPNQNYWKFNIGDGTNRIDLNGGLINDNAWHHVAVVINRSGDIVLYQDGVEIRRRANMTTTIPAATNLTTANKLGIGVDGINGYPFKLGYIAEVRIFNTAVSGADINTYKGTPYNALSTSHTNKLNLQYYYRGHEGSGTVYNDISNTASYRNSGTARNATITGLQMPTGQYWYSNNLNLTTYKYLNRGVPTNEDLAQTAFKWIGVPVDPAWGLDGKAIAVPAMPNTTVAVNDETLVTPGSATTINVLQNDTDAEGNTAVLNGIENPANTGVYTTSSFTVQGQKPDGSYTNAGTISAAANGNIQFTANATFGGIVKVKYKSTDNGTTPASAIGTVSIVVSPDVNTQPDLSGDAGNTPGTYANGNVNVTYSLIDNDGLQTGNKIVTGIQGSTAVTNTLAAGIPGKKSTIRVTFSKPVFNLRFSVTGIDEINSKNRGNADGDYVTVRATGISSVLQPGDFTTGDSVMYLGNNTFMPKATKGITMNSYSAIDASSSDKGNANFILAGPITTVEVDLAHIPWQTGTTQSHSVYVGNMNFTTAQNNQILPLKQLMLSGKSNNGSNLLTWQATGEENVVTYTLERSADARNFTVLYQINGRYSSIAETYQYADAAPLKNMSFYRVKAVETDGRVYYSPVVTLSDIQGNDGKIKLLNNPVQNNLLHLRLQGLQSGAYTLRIIGLKGQAVQQQTLAVNTNSQYVIMLQSGLTPGTYLLEVSNGSQRWVEKFIKD